MLKRKGSDCLGGIITIIAKRDLGEKIQAGRGLGEGGADY